MGAHLGHGLFIPVTIAQTASVFNAAYTCPAKHRGAYSPRPCVPGFFLPIPSLLGGMRWVRPLARHPPRQPRRGISARRADAETGCTDTGAVMQPRSNAPAEDLARPLRPNLLSVSPRRNNEQTQEISRHHGRFSTEWLCSDPRKRQPAYPPRLAVRTGTAGLSASHNGFRIGISFARWR